MSAGRDPRQDFRERVSRIQTGRGRRDAALPERRTGPARSRRRLRLPWRVLMLAVAGLFGFKALMLAQMGERAYGERLAALMAEGGARGAFAMLMAPDPLTRLIADGGSRVVGALLRPPRDGRA